MRVLNKYNNHELNSVTIQDGTNLLLNDHRPIANLVDDQIELIKLCIDKFQPKIVFVLEVPPNVIMINHFPINHNNASSLFAEQLRGQRQAGNLSSRGKRKQWSTHCHVQGQIARHPVQPKRERPSVALLEST